MKITTGNLMPKDLTTAPLSKTQAPPQPKPPSSSQQLISSTAYHQSHHHTGNTIAPLYSVTPNRRTLHSTATTHHHHSYSPWHHTRKIPPNHTANGTAQLQCTKHFIASSHNTASTIEQIKIRKKILVLSTALHSFVVAASSSHSSSTSIFHQWWLTAMATGCGQIMEMVRREK